MAKGIRVAKDGRSAVRGSGRDLSFTSEAQSLKINEQFRDTISSITLTGPGRVLVNIHHGLGYPPVFRLFVEATNGTGKWYNDDNSDDILDDNTAVSYAVVDINESIIQLVFHPFNLPAGQTTTVRYKYWLFDDALEQF